MAVICITGSASPRLQAIENILLQAGMQASRPAIKEEPIDIRQWHRHVVANIDGESSGTIKDPGRPWELLAGEIVLANLKSPLWGWCDPSSIRFLDFWLGFAPEFKFLLVCQTPQQLLAESLVNSDAPPNVEELLELWKSQHQEMLRFHHRNPERSILSYASDSVAHPDLLVAECSRRWNLSLSAAGIVTPSSPDALANFFAYQVSAHQLEIDALNREIIATATIFAPASAENLTREPQLEEILADYLALRQRLAEEERKSSNETARLQRELSGAREALTAQQGRYEASQIELQQENEQLLVQLQDVQEELEAVFLQAQETKKQIESLKKEQSVIGADWEALAAKYEGLQQELSAARLARDEDARVLSERQAQIDQLSKDRDQQKKLQQQAEDRGREREEQLSRVQAEMNGRQQENEHLLLQLSEAREALTAQQSRYEASQAELQSKNTQLLLQLEHVQGELETVFFKEQESKEQIELLKKEKSVAEAERDKHAGLLSERQAQNEQLTKDREQQKKLAGELQKQRETLLREREEQISRLQAEMKEQQQENESLLLQLHQTQEELEAVFLQKPETKKQIAPQKEEQSVIGADWAALAAKYEGLQQELSAARLARDEDARVLSERQAQIDQLSKDRDQQKKLQQQAEDRGREREEQLSRVQAEMKGQQQENGLLLRQLNQIQEELERYFLQNQQIQQQYNAAQVHFRRLLEREPNLYDYDELDVSPGTRGDTTPSVNCRLTNLIAAGRQFPALAFSVAIEQGIAGLIFPAATVATLLRPPLLATGESELVISPMPQRLDQLASLATSDWFLVTALIRLLNEALAQPQRLQWNSSFSSHIFRSGLQELARQVEPYDARLRYDEISLKREQVNPDYEHLWFEFGNLSFAGEIWPHFEFRLSCAHVRPDYFGGFPKLEFPAEGSQAPFQGWFIEANDDFGEKLELRFSLPDKALDLAVWERVTEHDRTFMKALTAALPEFLSTLRQSGVQIARSWEEWRTMAAEMQSIITQGETPSSAIVVAPSEAQRDNVSAAAGLHYDRVRLKREQVNPDYEHLWFEFGNLVFSGESWPHFEFRLSCAHVRPDYFGGFPKLEFPAEGSQAPFEGWFIEASDDFGEKLELRFSLPDKALDLAVWERVTEHDRAFMRSLVAELPRILLALRQSGVQIKRPWEDWGKIAEEMLPIVTNPPKLKGKKKSSFKKLLRRLQLAEK